jgi:hypothetical protein
MSDLLGVLTCGGSAGRQNRAALVRASGWEARLLAVLAMSGGGEEGPALDVASVMLQHCLLEGDAQSVARLHATLDLLQDGGHFSEESGRQAARVLCERASEQLAREQQAVGSACRAGGGETGQGLQRWLELVESCCACSSLQGSAACAVLAETALVSTGAGASRELFGLAVRLSLAASGAAVRLLDAGNVARREERMSEVEGVLLAGLDSVPQPMVEALAKFKSEKSKAWRAEEQLCGAVFGATGRRLQALLPLFASKFPGGATSATVLSTATMLLDTMKVGWFLLLGFFDGE